MPPTLPIGCALPLRRLAAGPRAIFKRSAGASAGAFRRPPGTPPWTPPGTSRFPPGPSAGWVGGAAAQAPTGPTGPGSQLLRVSAALARAGPGSPGNRLRLREAQRLEPAGGRRSPGRGPASRKHLLPARPPLGRGLSQRGPATGKMPKIKQEKETLRSKEETIDRRKLQQLRSRLLLRDPGLFFFTKPFLDKIL
nr:SWI/SNF-related matrix-associated actin-dependent regulator of chromatin subfamily D member 2-like [Pongo abelii]